MAIGKTPVTTTQAALLANQIPLGSVMVPGHALGDATLLEGGPASTDTNSNETAPVSAYIKDGGDIAQGLTTDIAVTGDVAGTLSAKMRGINKVLADIWDSAYHRIKVDGSGVTQPVSTAVPSVANLVGGSSNAHGATLLTIPAGKTFFGWVSLSASFVVPSGGIGGTATASIATGGAGVATPTGILITAIFTLPNVGVSNPPLLDRSTQQFFLILNAATSPVTLLTTINGAATASFAAWGYIQ